ncbi:M23 family metallopeptidase [Chloroflexota bacterium]
MKRSNFVLIACLLTILIFSVILLSGCAEYSESCPSYETVSLSEANTYADNTELPFRFPLDNFHAGLYGVRFAESSKPSAGKYHAAEDYHQPAGSPVYAMADGIVGFSGPRGGYGWLIIIDHPELSLYSLYGHLSPSRWKIKSGSVQKGQLIAYLGNSDENGGSKEKLLRPHLHFGIRSGQRTDYPTMGEWRWQAGWIKYCPQDLGWLQPSKIISEQKIPDDGFHKPESNVLAIWWLELLWSLLVLIGAVSVLLVTTFSKNKVLVLLFSIGLPLATWYFFSRDLMISYALIVLCVTLVSIRCFKFIRYKQNQTSNKTAD